MAVEEELQNIKRALDNARSHNASELKLLDQSISSLKERFQESEEKFAKSERAVRNDFDVELRELKGTVDTRLSELRGEFTSGIREAKGELRSEIASVKSEIQSDLLNLRNVLEGEVQKTNADVGQLSKDVSQIHLQIKQINEALNRSWFRDQKFWGGFIALPALILSGWIVKAAFEDAALLRLIHKGFGTEVALTEAFEDDSTLRSTVAMALTEQIYPTATDINDALTRRMGPHFVTKQSLGDDLQRAIGFQLRIQHVAVLSMGVQNLDAIQFPDAEKVILRDDAFESQASTVFGALPGQKLNISIGLNSVQINFDEVRSSRGESDRDKANEILEQAQRDTTGSIALEELITVFINGTAVEFERQINQFTHVIDGKTDGKRFAFEHYRLKDYEIPDLSGGMEFPLHTITVRVKSGNDNMMITTPIIISRSH